MNLWLLLSRVADLLDNTDCNVFGIDWSDLESWTNYFAAAETSMDVGVHVGEFISKLVLDTSLMVNDVHVIGHSLGAQGSGHAGRTVFSRTGSKVARITGSPFKKKNRAKKQNFLSVKS